MDFFNVWVDNIGERDRILELSEKDRTYLLDKVRSRLDTLVRSTEHDTMPKPVSRLDDAGQSLDDKNAGLLAVVHR